MLAYVFWHWPLATVRHEVYTDHLVAFHQALAQHAPAGFVRSAVFRCGPAPWIPEPQGGYQDWYLVEGSGALDALNSGAVAPGCRDAHDQAARLAAGGTAGLYTRWIGPDDLTATARTTTWFAKPAGMAYAELRDVLAAAQPSGSCWMRQLVLGPTPEFCWLGPSPLALPAIQNALLVPSTPLWPPG